MKNPFKLVNPRSLRILLLVFAALTVMAIIIIILVLQIQSGNMQREYLENIKRDIQSSNSIDSTGIENFKLDYYNLESGSLYPDMEAREAWSQEELESWLIDPRGLQFDRLSESSDALILRELRRESRENNNE